MNMQASEGANHLNVDYALVLMRKALMLLDEAGADLAGCRLQHAVDTLDTSQSDDPPE